MRERERVRKKERECKSLKGSRKILKKTYQLRNTNFNSSPKVNRSLAYPLFKLLQPTALFQEQTCSSLFLYIYLQLNLLPSSNTKYQTRNNNFYCWNYLKLSPANFSRHSARTAFEFVQLSQQQSSPANIVSPNSGQTSSVSTRQQTSLVAPQANLSASNSFTQGALSASVGRKKSQAHHNQHQQQENSSEEQQHNKLQAASSSTHISSTSPKHYSTISNGKLTFQLSHSLSFYRYIYLPSRLLHLLAQHAPFC